MNQSILTAERLREVLHYEPEAGTFTHRRKQFKHLPCGTLGQRGAIVMSIDDRSYYAHRLAWLYMTGSWPNGQIDHIDGNALNNKFNNLRECSDALNKQNKRKPTKTNKSGYLGVYLHGKSAAGENQWRARLQIGGKVIHIGLFSTPELAHQAYVEAKRIHHPFCTL